MTSKDIDTGLIDTDEQDSKTVNDVIRGLLKPEDERYNIEEALDRL